jgi:predicted transcriptional regulator
VHVFKALQLVKSRGLISRDLLSKELGLGEGSIRMLMRHLQMNNMIKATNAGTTMTQKGEALLLELHKKRSEFAAKSAAHLTIMNHEKHGD